VQNEQIKNARTAQGRQDTSKQSAQNEQTENISNEPPFYITLINMIFMPIINLLMTILFSFSYFFSSDYLGIGLLIFLSYITLYLLRKLFSGGKKKKRINTTTSNKVDENSNNNTESNSKIK
jgi:hypothetical protein